MSTNSIFPADVTDAESTYKHLIDRGLSIRAPHQCQWYYTNAYCQGMRNFRLNYTKGIVKASYTDAQGRTFFTYEELLAKYAMQKGRLLGLNLSPRVIRRNDSLNGQREAATVQAVLDDMFPATKIEKLKKAILQPFLFYGTLGLTLWEDKEDAKNQEIQLIPPWQITPIPTGVTHPSAARGVIIRKKVAIEDIRRDFRNMKTRSKAINTAEKDTVPRGEDGDNERGYGMYADIDAFMDMYQTNTKSGKTDGADRGKTDKVEVAWLGQVYLWDERDFMTERLIFVGTKLYARDPYWKSRTNKFVTTVHDMDVGGFWSRSWMELQIPINSEQEGAIGKTFQNVKTLDNYGITMIPMSYGIDRRAMNTPKPGGPKYQPYDHDGLNGGAQNIQQIRPFTSGTFATQALAMGNVISDRMGKQPPMLSGDAPGRVDSASALGTLMEAGNTPMAPASIALAHGFSEIYTAATRRARKTYNPADTIAVTLLDDSMVGVVYDARTGTVALSDSGVPLPEKVEITVRSMAPVSKEQQKLELDKMLNLQLIDATDYRILSRLKNLELPVGNNMEWESYVKARTENALLYHDGETVPEGSEEVIGVLFSREADMHVLHLRIHRELVSSVKFSMASLPVRKRILAHIELHETDGLGQVPEGMMPIEDEAVASLQAQQQQEQLGGQAPGGF